jgi:hypothetical protein
MLKLLSTFLQNERWPEAGKSNCRGRLSTVDLLVLTSLVELLFIWKLLSTFLQNERWPEAGKSNYRGRLSTIDLLVLTSLVELLFYVEIITNLFTKQAMARSREV